MKVNYVSAYVNKRIKQYKNNDIRGAYGRKIEIAQDLDIEDITSISNLVLSYCHAEVNGSIMLDGYNKIREDFDKDMMIAKETFEEEMNKLDLRGINIDVREIKDEIYGVDNNV